MHNVHVLLSDSFGLCSDDDPVPAHSSSLALCAPFRSFGAGDSLEDTDACNFDRKVVDQVELSKYISTGKLLVLPNLIKDLDMEAEWVESPYRRGSSCWYLVSFTA